MKLPFQQHQPIAILGLGIEGLSLLSYLHDKQYTNITLCDEKKDMSDLQSLYKTKGGKDAFAHLDSYEVIFRSPGIHKDHPELKKAQKKGAIITSATKLFFDVCPCSIIGITGTKGKGTTSTLIYSILKNAEKDVYLGGNIGESPLTFLDKLTPDSLVVLELSSFQLHDLTKSPHIAVVLNTTSEHLDYHKDTEEYLEAKESIVRYQTPNDAAIINSDYPYHVRYASITPAKKYYISTLKEVPHGAFITNNTITVKTDTSPVSICKTNEVGLIGKHNLENILPAATVASILHIDSTIITKTVQEFTGLPHRLELIRHHNGMNFYNDSFSTTPETCIAAIQAFTTPLILIAGGSEKHSDFTELGKTIVKARHLVTLVLIGETAKRIEKAVTDANKHYTEYIQKLEKQGNIILHRDIPLQIIHAKTFEEALFAAYINAKKDYTVLLSPASASFDMFENYKKRGEAFRKWVESL